MSLTDRILAYVAGHPGCTVRAVMQSVEGRNQSISDAVNELLDSGRLKDEADGGKPRRLVVISGAEMLVERPDPPDDLNELLERRKREFARKREHEQQRQLVTVKVRDRGPIGILHFGDPHVDDDGTDIEALERHCRLVRETPGLYAGNVGDTTNNWVGRLARLYGEQSTSAQEAWRIAEWFVGSCEWLYMVHGNHDCHDTETEALTQRGWKRVDDISDDDKVVGLDTQTGKWHWQDIRQIIRRKSDHLNYFENRAISLACTDGHRILFEGKNGLEYTTCAELSGGHIKMPVSGSSVQEADVSDDMIRLTAWIASDAHIDQHGRVSIYQRESKSHIVRDLLNRCGVLYRETSRHRNITSICGRALKSSEPEHTFSLPATTSRELLLRLGMSRENKMPQWLFDLSDRQFELYLSSKVDADGTRIQGSRNMHFVVYDDKATLDKLQALCHLHKYRATFYYDKRSKEGWRLNVTPKLKTYAADMRKHIRRVTGDFDVWCLTVPLSNFLVRRNNRVHFSGNCWSGAGDPLKWIAKQVGLQQPTDARLGLRFPGGREVRINIRHDFAGNSQYNPAHGSMKAALFGVKDHVLVNGHKHISGYGLVKCPSSGLISHCIQVASYKLYDRYARERGFRDQHISPCAVTVIDPSASETGLVQVFWEPEQAAEYLTWLRQRKAAI